MGELRLCLTLKRETEITLSYIMELYTDFPPKANGGNFCARRRKRMRILITLLLSVIISAPKGNGNLYAETAIVREIDYATDTVTVECGNGNLLCFSECDDWAEGDICSMLMDSKGTPEVADDEILSVKYSGYVRCLKL